MDGLSGAASVIAVVDISAKIFASCQRYAKEVKDARKDIQRLRDGVTSLQDVLTDIADMEQESDDSEHTVFARLIQHNGPVQQCEKELRSLLSELDVGEDDKKMRKFGARALKWPFSNKDVEKRLAEIETLKATFTLALTSDTLSFMRAMDNKFNSIRTGIEKLQLEQDTLATSSRQKEIRKWFAAPDPSSNHNAACKLHQKDTGNWLLESTLFQEWKTQPRSFLWLHGIPGAGKSILCSTVIEHVKSQYNTNQAVVSAYYYFSFTDSDKQKHDKFIRSIIEQFAWKSAEALRCLESLYSQCKKGTQQPTENELESTLRKMLKLCGESFIIIDALDECNPREDLLAFLGAFSSWEGKVHIIVTSRKERDIEQALVLVTKNYISLKESEIENDIQSYITERLRKSPRLNRWPDDVKEIIENTLTKKAQGMFRWVVCQMDVLEKCVSVTRIREALESLPQTLDGTYDRILQNINKDEIYRHDAFRIFQWLACATRPMLLQELAEVLAVDTVQSKFDPENRLFDPRDILTICSTLITTVVTFSEEDGLIDYNYDDSGSILSNISTVREVTHVYLAHFSIKEYLTSDRIRTKPEFKYNIQATAHDEIAQTCLTYLLYFEKGFLTREHVWPNTSSFPLLKYAAKNWCEHFRLAKEPNHITALAMELFEGFFFSSWLLINYGQVVPSDISKIGPPMYGPPLYHACAQGLNTVVALLLEKWTIEKVETTEYFRSPLWTSIISEIFEHDADRIDWSGCLNDSFEMDWSGCLNDSFEMACQFGHQETVTFLINKGADVDSDGYASAVCSAVSNSWPDIATLILRTVSTEDLHGANYLASLVRASLLGFREVVVLIIEKGLVSITDACSKPHQKAIEIAMSMANAFLQGKSNLEAAGMIQMGISNNPDPTLRTTRSYLLDTLSIE